MTADLLDAAIRTRFAPELRAQGFVGSGRTFRRVVGDFVQVVNIQSSRHGGQLAINLGVQPIGNPDVLGNAVDPRQITEPLCELRRRLAERGVDQWWEHDGTRHSIECALEEALAGYHSHGSRLFDRICAPGSGIDTVRPEHLKSSSLADRAGFGTTAVRLALLFARLRRAQRRFGESKAFATLGLELLGSATGLRRQFEELIGA
jgi:hypothetical protein